MLLMLLKPCRGLHVHSRICHPGFLLVQRGKEHVACDSAAAAWKLMKSDCNNPGTECCVQGVSHGRDKKVLDKFKTEMPMFYF